MEFHPIADEWPLMEGEAFAALVASVARHGVQVPCWTFEGKILDGRNRYRAARQSGVPVLNWHTFEGTETEARDLARLLNDERRHLGKEDRAAWVAKLRAKGLSLRAIGDAVGAPRSTVHDILNSGVRFRTPETADTPEPEACAAPPPPASSAPSSPASAPRPEPPKVTGRDGKQYPAKRPDPQPEQKPERKPPPAPPPPQSLTATEWSEFFAKLAAVQEFTGTITQKSIPSEMPKWQLLKLLEETARAILATATRLRRSP